MLVIWADSHTNFVVTFWTIPNDLKTKHKDSIETLLVEIRTEIFNILQYKK